MKKTILRTFLVCLFALTGVNAFAYDFEVDGIYYDYFPYGLYTSAQVASGDNKYSGAVEIPETVTYEGETYIVTSIAVGAFSNSPDLTAVTIPSTIISISDFERCPNLEKLIVKDGNRYYDSRENCNAIIETKSNTLVAGCKNTKIPSSVTAIGRSAFDGCSSLTELTIPDGVTSIASSAFWDCKSLKKIVIPNGVTSIEDYTFFNCSGLEEIVLHNGITSIGKSAFYGCSSLTELTIPESITSIEKETFYNCSSLTKLTIPENVTSIGDEAFYYCESLKKIVIPDGVTSIGNGAFDGCKSVTSLTIGNSVTSIGDDAFSGCAITRLTIPNSVVSIGEGAFEFCMNLTSVTLGNSLKSIGFCAFLFNESLVSVTSLNPTPPEIIDEIAFDVFDDTQNTTLYVPKGSQALYAQAKGWRDFYPIRVLEGIVVSTGTNGLATYCPTTTGLDFSGATEIAAYKASVSDNTVKLTRVETVAAGEGVLLRSLNGGAASEQLPTIEATANADNAFIGTTEDITLSTTDGNVTNFVLSDVDGVVGFFKANDTPLTAGKAYLPVENYDAARGLTIVFDDNTTGISEVAPVQPADDAFYTLDGVRVTAPAKGLYIKNGKKVFIK